MAKLYKILKGEKTIESSIPGEYAGHRRYKIFGTLDCRNGKKMKKENRVFFHTLEDAVKQGYRPCNNCKPMDEEKWEEVKYLVPDCRTLHEFYRKNIVH